MNIGRKKKIVLLGMMSRIPVAGAVWGTMQYLIGFQRLGFDVYYVEAHARTPTMLMETPHDDSSAKAAAYIDRMMRFFDMGDKWAFHALHDKGDCYGRTELQLKELYKSADLIINYHGGTAPRPEHYETDRLIYLETDPVELEIELFDKKADSLAFVAPHKKFFTWGLNYGHPDCLVPMPEGIQFHISCPVVVCDFWEGRGNGEAEFFTTIGNWRQPGQVAYQGEIYYWSKHHEFMKLIDLPQRTGQRFELGLSSYNQEDLKLLESHGWKVRPAREFSADLDDYRSYITNSRGEFTVAKDQNVRLRSGWFSERSAQYLAAGRPVITQETGFSNVLPSGKGLFGFSSLEDVLSAVDSINSGYAEHCQAALELARSYFNYEIVLPRLLDEVGITSPQRALNAQVS